MHTLNLSDTQATLLAILVVWELVWKGIALWHAARRGQKAWFVALIVLNTAGILPILYLFFTPRPAADTTPSGRPS